MKLYATVTSEGETKVNDPMLQSHMINLLKEKLDERGLIYYSNSMDVRYSLSHSQGDGFMFIGHVMWRGKEVIITHSDAHYYHMRTAKFDYSDELTEAQCGQFEVVYESICTEMEKIGYNEIEYQQSAENFQETCEANEYTFEEDGTMRTS